VITLSHIFIILKLYLLGFHLNSFSCQARDLGVTKLSIEVVIILGSSQIALAIAREVRCLGVGTVEMIDTVSDVGSFSNCSNFHQLPQNVDFGDVLFEIDKFAVEGKTALFADSDRWLDFVKTHRIQLDEMVSVQHPTNDVLDLCLSKSKFARWCADNSIRTAQLISDAEIANGLLTSDYPLILRPDKDVALKIELPKCICVETASELKPTIERYANAGVSVAVTRSLLGLTPSQVSVGFCRRSNGDCVTFVAEKIRPFANYCGTGTFVKSSSSFEYIRLIAANVAEKMNFTGVGEMEFLVDKGADQAYLIEVNARPWMQFSLAKQTGVHIVAFSLQEELASSENQQSLHRVRTWCNFGRDFEFLLAQVLANKLSLLNFIRQCLGYLRVSEWAFFRIQDLRPVFKFSMGWGTRFLVKVNTKSFGHLKIKLSAPDKG
jgi:predicted ATP-grasp superfamily ATP-dependent carboligase